jgi:uncharacterized membrane protein
VRRTDLNKARKNYFFGGLQNLSKTNLPTAFRKFKALALAIPALLLTNQKIVFKLIGTFLLLTISIHRNYCRMRTLLVMTGA